MSEYTPHEIDPRMTDEWMAEILRDAKAGYECEPGWIVDLVHMIENLRAALERAYMHADYWKAAVLTAEQRVDYLERQFAALGVGIAELDADE